MANGCPVFATKVGGTTEVIQDGKNGILLTPMRPDAWVEPLLSVKDTPLMLRMRQAAHDTAQKMFPASHHASQFLNFYEKAINAYHSRLHAVSKKPPVVKQEKTGRGVSVNDGMKVLILGDWEWPIGVDGVLRVIGKIMETAPHSLACRVLGCGSQKDELQYLCNFSNILRDVKFIEVNRNESELQRKLQEEWGDCILTCRRYGEVTLSQSTNQQTFTSLEELERALQSYVTPPLSEVLSP